MKNVNKKSMLFAVSLIFLLSSFLSAAAAELTVNAKGSKSHGIYAHFKVVVNGMECGDSFTSSEIKDYCFSIPFSENEIEEIKIVFDNDHYCMGQDRNLFIESIQIGEEVRIDAEGEGVKYFCMNGKELEYDGMMGWNGTLAFDLSGISKDETFL